MRRGWRTVALTAALAALAPAAGAQGGASMTGWDGVNPFRCALQNAGTGTAVPDPSADHYCV